MDRRRTGYLRDTVAVWLLSAAAACSIAGVSDDDDLSIFDIDVNE